MEYMYALKSESIPDGALDMLNKKFYLQMDKAEKLKELQEELQDLYERIAQTRQKLALLESQASPVCFTKENLEGFFEKHPAMSLMCESDVILRSYEQCVSFHMNRNIITHKQNDDIIYVTLPLYSFDMCLQRDGHVRIERGILSDLVEIFKDSPLIVDVDAQHYGHPHATLSTDHKTFNAVCQGNNQYIADYEALIHNGRYDASDLLILLHRAAVWLETVNLSDMYGTFLSPALTLTNDFYSQENIDVIDRLFGFCQQYTDGTASVDSVLQSIKTFLEDRDESTSCIVKLLRTVMSMRPFSGRLFCEIIFRITWAMWLVVHYRELSGGSLGDDTLLTACKADFVFALSLDSVGFNHLFMSADWRKRTRLQSLKAPIELRNYFEQSGQSNACLEQIRPFAITL